jgi:predicted nucleic acid-binding Zn ribbon protein
MPTYVYRRSDGTTFEIEQRITEPALATDPETGLPVERVISGAGLVFKGSGFYLTDYARKGADTPKTSGSDSTDAGPPKGAERTDAPSTKSEPTPAAAAAPAPAPAAPKSGSGSPAE